MWQSFRVAKMLKKPLHHLQEPLMTVYWEQLAKTEAASCSSLGINLGIQEGVNSSFLPSCPSHLYQLGFNLCITKSDFEAALALARCS